LPGVRCRRLRLHPRRLASPAPPRQWSVSAGDRRVEKKRGFVAGGGAVEDYSFTPVASHLRHLPANGACRRATAESKRREALLPGFAVEGYGFTPVASHLRHLPANGARRRATAESKRREASLPGVRRRRLQLHPRRLASPAPTRQWSASAGDRRVEKKRGFVAGGGAVEGYGFTPVASHLRHLPANGARRRATAESKRREALLPGVRRRRLRLHPRRLASPRIIARKKAPSNDEAFFFLPHRGFRE
jgi:hypothetical protein